MLTIVKSIIAALVGVLCLLLQRFRRQENQKYAERALTENINNPDRAKKLINSRIFSTEFLRLFSLFLLWDLYLQELDSFVAVYVLTPILLALHLAVFNSSVRLYGIISIVKALYYLALSIISLLQF